MTDYEQIVISAVRYGLGRMSYIVGTICRYVADERKKLSTNCLNIIIRDIREEIEMCHRLGKTCGMDFDERTWQNLMTILEQEVESR